MLYIIVESSEFVDFCCWVKKSVSLNKGPFHLKVNLSPFFFSIQCLCQRFVGYFIAYLMFLIAAIMQSKGNIQLPVKSIKQPVFIANEYLRDIC